MSKASVVKKVLLVAVSKYSNINRLKRVVAALPEDVEVHLASDQPFLGDEVEYIPLGCDEGGLLSKAGSSRFVISKNYEKYYWGQTFVKDLLSKVEASFDLVIASELETLPCALKIAGDTSVTLDVCTSLEQGFTPWGWKGFETGLRQHIAQNYCEKAFRIFASSEKICESFSAFNGNITVLTPYPLFQDLAPQEADPSTVRLVFFGNDPSYAQVTPILDLFEETEERFHLDLFLDSSKDGDIEKIKSRAYTIGRVNIFEVEGGDNLSKTMNRYDLAFFSSDPEIDRSEEFFQCIQARIGVLIFEGSPFSPLVRPYQLGLELSSNNEQALAAFSKLTKDQIDLFKRNCHRVANNFSFEQTKNKVKQELSQLFETTLV